MLSKLKSLKQQKSDKGFTIIEVMIVLAIAGLILLIVFLAVPALQRNARNTQRKNDSAQVAAAVANEISNNGGNQPSGLSIDAADSNSLDVCAKGGTATPVTGTTGCGTGNNLEAAKLGFYTPTNISLVVVPTAGPVPANPTLTATQMDIYVNVGCNVNNNGLGGTVNTRTDAIVYATESSSSAVSLQCVEQ